MRFGTVLLAVSFTFGSLMAAEAKTAPATEPKAPAAPIEISAEQSLEWYQDKNLYVARGQAKAVRGETTVTADMLTAHQRDKATPQQGQKNAKKPEGSGDIDKMMAEGNVVIFKSNARITGDRAIDDVDKKMTIVTGNNLRYETDKQIVTARDSLEYWEDSKIAVARGKAVAIKEERHVEGDVLTAEFRDAPDGSSQLYKMSAVGNVTVITKNDIVRGDRGVYDAARDIAVVSGHVRITRPDGTELTGDVGESDFATNQSRLMNDGSGRVRALLPAKSSDKAAKPAKGTP